VPYTPVHTLVVLPLLGERVRRRVPADILRWAVPAAAAGAMVPDAPIFLDVLVPGTGELGHGTHTVWAAFSVDLVLALLLATLWVRVLRSPVLGALPRRSRRADAPALGARPALTAPTDPRVVLGVTVAAAVVGTLTHLAWDDLTHLRGHAVQAWDVLREPVGGYALYKLLQHGSSAVGVLGLVVAAVVGWRRSQPAPSRHLPSALLTAAAGVVVGLAGAVVRVLAEGTALSVYSVARLSATYPVLGAAVALVVWAVVVGRRATAQPGEPSSA